jgi:hypothetical protein
MKGLDADTNENSGNEEEDNNNVLSEDDCVDHISYYS